MPRSCHGRAFESQVLRGNHLRRERNSGCRPEDHHKRVAWVLVFCGWHKGWGIFLWLGAFGLCGRLPGASMKFWQQDETGRICAAEEKPSDRWYEISRELYMEILP